MPGDRHSVRLENKERSDYVFLRYGIQSLYIGATRSNQKAKTLDSRLKTCGNDGASRRHAHRSRRHAHRSRRHATAPPPCPAPPTATPAGC